MSHPELNEDGMKAANLIIQSMPFQGSDSFKRICEQLVQKYPEFKLNDTYGYLTFGSNIIKDFLYQKEYINTDRVNEDSVTLIENGREAKRSGSIEKYLQKVHKKKTLKILWMVIKLLAAIAAIVGAILLF